MEKNLAALDVDLGTAMVRALILDTLPGNPMAKVQDAAPRPCYARLFAG